MTEIDKAMLKSIAISLRTGLPFSFNPEDMADLLDRVRSDENADDLDGRARVERGAGMITPQKQTLRHDPDNGVHGDCYRTAVAMLMGLEAKDLPHFADVGVSDHVVALREYLAAHGYGLMQFIYPPETEIQVILNTLAHLSPGVPFMLSGKSPRGDYGHVVVAIDGRIADPATGDWVPDPEDALHGAIDEWWWIEAIVALPKNEVPE